VDSERANSQLKEREKWGLSWGKERDSFFNGRERDHLA
jgi:hypothetical protein